MKVWIIFQEEDAGDMWYRCDAVVKVVDSEDKAKKALEGKHQESCGDHECKQWHWKYEEYELE